MEIFKIVILIVKISSVSSILVYVVLLSQQFLLGKCV